MDYLHLHNKYGLGLTIWSPLAFGFLTGKYNSGNIPSDIRFALENYKVKLKLEGHILVFWLFFELKTCHILILISQKSSVDC